MACLIIIAAEDYLPIQEDRVHFESAEEAELYCQKAIEMASELVGKTSIYNAVVTVSGSLMAMVRWNLDVHADPPIEVARFRHGLVPY